MGRVFDGGYADHTCVPATQVIPFRSDLDWATIGAVPEMLQTAYGSLTTGLDARTGQSILIRGGTSSVGLTTAVLARQRGMTILSTTRNPEKAEALTRAGADHVLIDDGNVARQVRDILPGGADAALELVGTPTLPDTLRSVRVHGVVCFTGMLSNQWIVHDFYPLDYLPKGVRLTAYEGDAADLPPPVLQDFLDAVAAGTATVPISRVYRFDQIVEGAHRHGTEPGQRQARRHDMRRRMTIAVLGSGRVGSTIGRLWHAAGHDVTFAARHPTRPRALAAELGEGAHAASVADAVAAADAVFVAVPGPAVTDVLRAAGRLDGRIVIDAANSFGKQQLSLRSLADAFPRARWVRAFNSLSVNVMADDHHRQPPWVLFLSGDDEAKPVVAQLIRDAGFDPVDLGGIDDSQLQDPGSALWTYAITHDEATALVARIKSGDPAAADPLTAPFEKYRDHAPDDPAFFLEHLSRSVFEAGMWQVAQNKWDGIREAFHGFDPAQVAAMTPAQIAATENDARVIRNKAKIRATVANAREVLTVVDSYGSIRAYFASFPDAHAASADMRRRFKFLGDTGLWRLLNSAARDIGSPNLTR
jgi:predicted dinucleotide-binding enzyme/3-methyladenine DNA glycosylase Tag